ncbi:MAG: phosphatase PAP2 family protein, partial [Actinomycetota bacterium]|nr:phosphatase PAP2 family protein [Actinomycetota bacterium]
MGIDSGLTEREVITSAFGRARTTSGWVRWRDALGGPAVAVASLIAALIATRSAGLPLRDPDGVASGRLGIAAGLVAGLVVVDILVRAWKRSPGLLPTAGALLAVRRERWTSARVLPMSIALLSFFASYFAYRNLKSVVPLLRPEELFDEKLENVDRAFFGGHDPSVLLHDLLGTGTAAHAMSFVYLLFFVFIPVSLAMTLVFSSDLRAGLFYTTAFSVNWLLGAASYFILPSIGPFEATPGVFSGLPSTAASQLQSLLLDERIAFVRDPAAAGAAQGIGAFASLHVSVYVTAALAMHLLGFGRLAKASLWSLVGLTVASTVYLGWHYVIDDIGGVAIAGLALVLARVITGFDLSAARRMRQSAPGLVRRQAETLLERPAADGPRPRAVPD